MATWYLHAVSDHPPTNNYLVRVIGEQNSNSEYLRVGKVCADGKPRNLFTCPRGYLDVKRAIAAISEYGLNLEVFKEEITDVIVHFDLWKQGVRKKALHANLGRGIHRGSGT